MGFQRYNERIEKFNVFQWSPKYLEMVLFDFAILEIPEFRFCKQKKKTLNSIDSMVNLGFLVIITY